MSAQPIFMEIPWETRNLGVPSFQIRETTTPGEMQDAIASARKTANGRFFAQTKIPADHVNAIHVAESAGFRIAELAIDPWTELERSSVFAKYLKDRQAFSPAGIEHGAIESTRHAAAEIDSKDKATIVEISERVFVADRFHMDPNCPKEIADRRIGMWVDRDLLSTHQATMCTITRYKSQIVGYIIWKGDRFILGGLAKEFIGKGFAKMLYLDSMRHVHDDGAAKLSTTISINNIEVLNLYAKLGFSFRSPHAVLHYWG